MRTKTDVLGIEVLRCCRKWSPGVFEIRAENGCPWDGWICRSAALEGRLECLKYAHEKGCPWDETTCKYAAQNVRSPQCLKYAHENG